MSGDIGLLANLFLLQLVPPFSIAQIGDVSAMNLSLFVLPILQLRDFLIYYPSFAKS